MWRPYHAMVNFDVLYFIPYIYTHFEAQFTTYVCAYIYTVFKYEYKIFN